MARVSNRLTLDDDNGMGWYADTSFKNVGTRGQGGDHPSPHSNFGRNISKTFHLKKFLYYYLQPPPSPWISDFPTALNLDPWQSIYVPTNHTRGVRAQFLLFFTAPNWLFAKVFSILYVRSLHYISTFKMNTRQIHIFFRISNARQCWFTRFIRLENVKMFLF